MGRSKNRQWCLPLEIFYLRAFDDGLGEPRSWAGPVEFSRLPSETAFTSDVIKRVFDPGGHFGYKYYC